MLILSSTIHRIESSCESEARCLKSFSVAVQICLLVAAVILGSSCRKFAASRSLSFEAQEATSGTGARGMACSKDTANGVLPG